jgi:hypothetical protein
MLTRRRMSRGWEKLNNWVIISVDEENIMDDNAIIGHYGKRQKPKEKPKEKSKEKSRTLQMPTINNYGRMQATTDNKYYY